MGREPVLVQKLNPLAQEILERLGREAASAAIEIGGGIALWHYLPYRSTNDIDAWWSEDPPAAREAITRTMEEVALSHGLACRHRGQSGYESWDLQRQGKTVFAFQIARKSLRLEGSLSSPWGYLRLESLRENLASKMSALVQRGAPRDFLDISELLERGLTRPGECWELWQAKNPAAACREARAALLANLGGLESRRPLASIADADERRRASEVRERIRSLATLGD